jgi:mono/diheme cytochrome c family protein
MTRIAAFLLGVIATLVLAAAGGYLIIRSGWIPANADAEPGAFEKWAARTSLHATLAREMPQGDAPIPASPENLRAGMKLYGEHCAFCHGLADGKATDSALGLFQKPPQLAKHPVTRDPVGATYWRIAHGIRLTGMPGYRANLSENQVWQLTVFLKEMEALPAPLETEWKALR